MAPTVFEFTKLRGPVTVIAVHGNGGGSFRFSLVAERTPPSIRFVAPDLPGFGSAGRQTGLPSVRAYAEWLADVVAQTPTPRVLLGHGIGAAFILELLQRHRHLVDGVILHAPVGALLSTRLFPSLMKPRAMRTFVQQMLATPILRPFWRWWFFRGPVPDHVVEKFFSNYGRCAVFGSMFDMISARWFDSLRAVHVPAILLWGAKERVVRPEQAEAYTAVLPDLQLVIEPEWDHFPMIDAPRQYANRIAELAQQLA